MTFQLDTSGSVGIVTAAPQGGSYCQTIWWNNLPPFTQGYIEALMAPLDIRVYGFSDLAPETLARIMADCDVARTWAWSISAPDFLGREFWRLRQEGRYGDRFPPLTVTIGDDSKVRVA